jgi:hypothetical protein
VKHKDLENGQGPTALKYLWCEEFALAVEFKASEAAYVQKRFDGSGIRFTALPS